MRAGFIALIGAGFVAWRTRRGLDDPPPMWARGRHRPASIATWLRHPVREWRQLKEAQHAWEERHGLLPPSKISE